MLDKFNISLADLIGFLRCVFEAKCEASVELAKIKQRGLDTVTLMQCLCLSFVSVPRRFDEWDAEGTDRAITSNATCEDYDDIVFPRG